MPPGHSHPLPVIPAAHRHSRPSPPFPRKRESTPRRCRPPRRPPPSFRRRPESRTPVRFGWRIGRGVDSRFRGNDGVGCGCSWREFPTAATGVLDSGLRRNDGGEWSEWLYLWGVDSRFRGNDGGIADAAGGNTQPPLPGFWIPACAGMTVGDGRSGCIYGGWIPAFAGMTAGLRMRLAGIPNHHYRGSGFRPAPE